MQLKVSSSEAMTSLGGELARRLRLSGSRGLIYLAGELGTGKTTLVRGLLRGLGHQGAVKSPTFAIVEPYLIDNNNVYHFDLYRLGDPEELELLGGREHFSPENLCLVEWPECAAGALPKPDLLIELKHAGPAREVTFTGHSVCGQAWCENLSQKNLA